MAKDLHETWLYGQTQGEDGRQWITKILEWRHFVLENNRFIKDKELFSVALGNYLIWFKKCSAFSSIEVYQEIFKENNHCLLSDFSGKHENLIIDIGANEGFYTLKMKENNPNCKIICIEPNPYLFEILNKNIASNHLKNTILVNKAIDLNNGLTDFEIIEEIGAIGGKSLSFVERPWLKDEFIRKIVVETITLSDLCREHFIPKIGILKIDVEGMEIDVLKSGEQMLHRARKIVIERHSRKLRDDIIAFLTTYDFELVYEEDPDFRRYYGDLYFIKRNVT